MSGELGRTALRRIESEAYERGRREGARLALPHIEAAYREGHRDGYMEGGEPSPDENDEWQESNARALSIDAILGGGEK